MNLQQLLYTAGTTIEAKPVTRFPDNLANELYPLGDSWQQWDEEVFKPLTYRVVLKDIDRADKYGRIISILYYEGQPGYIVSRSGKWHATWVLYPVNPVVVNNITQHLKKSIERMAKEDGTYIDEYTVDQLVADLFGDVEPEQLPIIRNDHRGPKEILLEIANAQPKEGE